MSKISQEEQDLIQSAISILERSFKEPGDMFTSSDHAEAFVRLHLAAEENEVFSVMFLDQQNRLIRFDKMFQGTINGAIVYTREIVRRVIELNAAAILLSHNHPSGNLTPSNSDLAVTKRISTAMELIDCRVLDHIIATKTGTLSFAKEGLL